MDNILSYIIPAILVFVAGVVAWFKKRSKKDNNNEEIPTNPDIGVGDPYVPPTIVQDELNDIQSGVIDDAVDAAHAATQSNIKRLRDSRGRFVKSTDK